MTEFPHLENAPITEALIDIRTKLPGETTFEDLSRVRDAVAGDYPKVRERRRFRGQVSFDDSAKPTVASSDDTPDGYLLDSADGTQVLQTRLDGFTFSRLRPYECWSNLRDEARRLWDVFCKEMQPVFVSRIAVRYINRIEFTKPVGDLKDWLSTVPEIAKDLPQEMAGYFFQIHLPFQDPHGFVNINQKLDAGTDGDTVRVILDIDAFLPMEVKPDSRDVWDRFEDLRLIKNEVFFRSTTRKTQELFR